MITVISGTNRPGSKSRIVAEIAYNYLKSKDIDVNFLSLETLPVSILNENMYDGAQMSDELIAIQEEMIFPAEKLLLVSPEYNGSYPGILKLFIDAISVREYPKNFKTKKLAQIGVSAGRAGNIVGMNAIAEFMNYLGLTTFPQKLPLSSIESILTEGKLDDDTNKSLEQLLDGFVEF